eukprot:CAMPEP_0181341206 /NCGR_PEP_ID=MMETSP1101-20121128/30274_1 /TAXON_ID=46948 /ORGANISM="Rhodomonas abbreviata, Strain Caron Lab Isolate" /LENGTH=40 /DNA_ID= /DNA_START= /DNA_END= /DNA_ORIENTATION=
MTAAASSSTAKRSPCALHPASNDSLGIWPRQSQPWGVQTQ